jgi:hypothetical protein
MLVLHLIRMASRYVVIAYARAAPGYILDGTFYTPLSMCGFYFFTRY